MLIKDKERGGQRERETYIHMHILPKIILRLEQHCENHIYAHVS